jgi:hypothetical protein
MSKKKSEESTKSKSKKTGKKASAEITVDGAAVTDMDSLQPKQRRSGREKKISAAKPEFSSHDIALRAYYISERRRDLSLPGDELGDWVEAERQLRKERLTKSR